MASRTQRQLALLGALVVVLIGVVMWRSGEPTPAGTDPAPSNGVSGTAGQRPPVASTVDVADVQLDLLKAPRGEAPESGRNLFRFRPKAPPPSESSRSEIARPIAEPPPVPLGPPPPPPIALRFIGLVTSPRAGRVAALSDNRNNVFYGREGDIIEGRYRVLRIGADSVELAYTDGRGRQVIRLAGQ
jgi:hypothetical protein